MSDYGEQWRERKQRRQSYECNPCLCGRRLMRSQKTCFWCESENPEYKPNQQGKAE